MKIIVQQQCDPENGWYWEASIEKTTYRYEGLTAQEAWEKLMMFLLDASLQQVFAAKSTELKKDEVPF